MCRERVYAVLIRLIGCAAKVVPRCLGAFQALFTASMVPRDEGYEIKWRHWRECREHVVVFRRGSAFQVCDRLAWRIYKIESFLPLPGCDGVSGGHQGRGGGEDRRPGAHAEAEGCRGSRCQSLQVGAPLPLTPASSFVCCCAGHPESRSAHRNGKGFERVSRLQRAEAAKARLAMIALIGSAKETLALLETAALIISLDGKSLRCVCTEMRAG